jgi:voltage-gated potassium channel
MTMNTTGKTPEQNESVERANDPPPGRAAWRNSLYQVIFEAETPAGQLFDIALLAAILLSITTVSLETVEYFQHGYWPKIIWSIELILTVLFTLEYFARLACVERPAKYALSFFGIIDLLAWLPLYLAYFSVEYQSLMIVRSIRLLRVFRVLKMMRMLREAHSLRDAVWRSRDKIFVFIAVVMVAVTISGTLMYQIEHNEAGSNFSSIPQAMYWAIVTMTTVGYGDIVPQTIIGKIISALLILLGYSLIIVPTGFVSAEITALSRKRDLTSRACPHCLREGHSPDAAFCDMCGERLLRRPASEPPA